MPDGALAPMPGVFLSLRHPANEPVKDVGPIDVALSRKPRERFAKHQQIALALELVHARLQRRRLQRRREIGARPGAG